MRIIIWSPYISPGGGLRFLSSLLPGLVKSPDVEEIEMMIPENAEIALSFRNISEKIKIIRLKRDPISIIIGKIKYLITKLRITRPVEVIRKRIPAPQLFVPYRQKFQHKLLEKLINDCDIVYSPWPHSLEFPPVRKPVVCTFQDAITLDFPELLGGYYSVQEKNSSQRWLTNCTITVISSNSTRKALLNHFPAIPESKFELISHAILPREINDANQDISFENQKIPKQYILCITNLSHHKNLQNLLYAWAKFEFRNEYPLVIIGYGTEIFGSDWELQSDLHWQQDNLLGIMIRNNLVRGEQVYGLGYVSDSEAEVLLKNATALIMPSLAEGGGSYPVEEAIYFGIPVLCSDIPVMHEHLDNRNSQVTWFDPISPSDILKALQEFMNNKETYINNAKSFNYIAGRTWEQIASDYVQVFKKAINQSIKQSIN